VDLTGVISAIEGDVWVINDVKFKVVRGTTKIDGAAEVGAVAKARLVGQRGGELVAVAITVRKAPSKDGASPVRPGSGEAKPVLPGGASAAAAEVLVITGTIQKIERDVWTVREHEFVRNARSTVHGDPKVGAVVKMTVRRAEDGKFVILEARVASIDASSTGGGDKPAVVATPVLAAGEQVLEGAIEKVDGDVLVVNGLRVLVVPHILEKREVGLKVKCAVRRTERAVLEAVRCVVVGVAEKAPAPTQAPAVPEFKTVTGVITGLGDGGRVWLIDGRKVAVAADARIDGRPVAGAKVKALVRLDGDVFVVVAASIALEATATR
jgi:hypothetical protein